MPQPARPAAAAIELAAAKQPAAFKPAPASRVAPRPAATAATYKPAVAEAACKAGAPAVQAPKPPTMPKPAAAERAPGAAGSLSAHHTAAAVGVRSAPVPASWWPPVAQAWQGQARQQAQAWIASLEPLPPQRWLTEPSLQRALLASAAAAPPPAAAARQRQAARLVAAAVAPDPERLADDDGEAQAAGSSQEPSPAQSAVAAHFHAWLLAQPGNSASSTEVSAWAAQHGIPQRLLQGARRALTHEGRLRKEDLGSRRYLWTAVSGRMPSQHRTAFQRPVVPAPAGAGPALPLQLSLLSTLHHSLVSLQARMQAQAPAPQLPPQPLGPQQRQPLAPLPQPPRPASSPQLQKPLQQQAIASAAMPVEQKQGQQGAAAAVLEATAGKPRLGKTVRGAL